MKVTSIKTHRILPGESLFHIITRYIPKVPDKTIIAVTSKILSISQQRIIPKDQVPKKFELIQEEADFYLEGDYTEKYGIWLTIKNGILIPTAGIDESNSDGHYILYPVHIQEQAKNLWQTLKEFYQITHLGILITDSHTTPLRRGVTGICLGWCGFSALYNYIGKPDIYGNPLRVTQTNLIDGLASTAVLMMGEGNEQTPLVIFEEFNEVEKLCFQDHPPTEEELAAIFITPEQDLYAPLIAKAPWKTKKMNKNINKINKTVANDEKRVNNRDAKTELDNA